MLRLTAQALPLVPFYIHFLVLLNRYLKCFIISYVLNVIYCRVIFVLFAVYI